MKAKIYYTLFVCLLIAIIVMQRACEKECEPVVITKDSIIVKVDTVQLPGKVVYKPKPYEVIQYDTILDTVEVLNDYADIKKYNLLLLDDTNGKIIFFADVQRNEIKQYNIEGELYPKHTIIERHHYIIEEKRMKVYAGISAGYQFKDNKPFLAPTIALNTKKDNLYTLQYEPLSQGLILSLYWKIRLTK